MLAVLLSLVQVVSFGEIPRESPRAAESGLGSAAPRQELPVTGVVFDDRNRNGRRDSGEPGLPGVAVSNQHDVALTGADGSFTLSGPGTGLIFVSVPDGYRSAGPFWRTVLQGGRAAPVAFGLVARPSPSELTFIHASDPHVAPASAHRIERLRAVVDSLRPDFVLITGDLVRDALRVSETEARGYYDLYRRLIGSFPAPVYSVPGNHELFGIERHTSLVSPSHPLYGRGMYRHYLGPDYYSFTWGGVHFVGLNTANHDDLWYYGAVDSVQAAWLARDLARLPAGMPVVTFNHIPFFTAVEVIRGYHEDSPAPTLIEVRGKRQFRHAVANAREILTVLGVRPHPLALGGHMHVRERLRYELDGRDTRFEQAAAVVGGWRDGPIAVVSGVTLYRVRGGRIDEGTFIRLDPSTATP